MHILRVFGILLKDIRIGISYCGAVKFSYSLQAGILAVGRGNKVVEPVIGNDGKMLLFLQFQASNY